MRRWFDINRPLIFFVSGEVFFVMGMAILLQTRRYSRLALAHSMNWLAMFGVLHGFYQWGGLFIPMYSAHAPEGELAIMEALQLLLLASSFAALLQFGIQLMRPLPKGLRWVQSVPLFALVVWLALPFYLGLALGKDIHLWRANAEMWARYGLGIPAGVVAAWGLRHQAKRQLLPADFPAIYRMLRIAGVALLAYAILAGAVVPPAGMFPANLINTTTFAERLIVPVEVVQGVVGLVLAIAVVLGLEVFEFETERLIERMEQNQVVAMERERIARDLHDGAIQQVYAAGLLAQSLMQRASDAQMKAGLKRLLEGINAAIVELRRFLSELHEQETLDLAAALESLVEEARRISGTEVYLKAEEVPPMSPEVSTHVLAFAREAISNAIRHARSSVVQVRLSYLQTSRWVRLEVEDYGIGLPDDPDLGYGLRNMEDRARLLGGSLTMESSPGKGTRAILDFPLDGR